MRDSTADPERQTWMVRLVAVHRGEAIATEVVRIYPDGKPQRRDQVQYAASQLADEENHVSLFERFQREVPGLAEAQIRQTETCGWTCSPYRTLAAETLPRLSRPAPIPSR